MAIQLKLFRQFKIVFLNCDVCTYFFFFTLRVLALPGIRCRYETMLDLRLL